MDSAIYDLKLSLRSSSMMNYTLTEPSYSPWVDSETDGTAFDPESAFICATFDAIDNRLAVAVVL